MSESGRKVGAFFLLVVAAGIFLLVKTVRFSFDEGAITMKIVRQKGPIVTVDTPRKPAETKRLPLRVIDFAPGRMLETAQYGKMGYRRNFFLDLSGKMKVGQGGTYRFEIRSDDGFRLKIDGKEVCAHPGDRPFGPTVCRARLAPGEHVFILNYFQGGGPMGLQARYTPPGGGKSFLFGEDSDALDFEASR